MDELRSARRVLGVSAQSTRGEVKTAFRAAAKTHHPDHGGDPTSFAQLRRAYDVALAVAKPDRNTRSDAFLTSGRETQRHGEHVAAAPRRGERPTRRSFADILRQELGYV